MSTTDMDESCASYSPSLVKMISSFVKSGKEDAEVRAQKSLTILQAKDLQLQQLQERISILEDYVNNMEGYLEKPKLPVSASVYKSEDDIVTRDVDDFTVPACKPSQQLLLLLPQDFLESSPENFIQVGDAQSTHVKKEHVEVSACHDRWQTVVEQLEQYNKQLEADLKHENKLRLKDKQKYCDALAGVTEALCHVKSAMEEVKQYWGNCKPDGENNSVLQGMMEETNEQNLKHTLNQIQNKSKSLLNIQLPPEDKLNHNHNQSSPNFNYQSFNKNQIIDRLLEAQRTIVDLQNNILETDERYKREWCMRKSLEKILEKYHRPYRCSISDSPLLSSFRPRKKKYLFVTKRKVECKFKLNKLQKKITHLKSDLEKKNESFKKLKMEIVNLSETCTALRDSEEKFKIDTVKKDELIKELKEKLVRSPTSELLKGRLDAVAQVMAKQHKQIKQSEQECQESRTALENIKKRLSRAEALNTKRETLAETWQKQQSDMEIKLVAEQEKNKSLIFEVSKLRNVISSLNSQIANLKQQYDDLIKKKNECETNLMEMKTIMEHKLNILSETLQKKISSSEKSETVLQNKLGQLRTQFVSRIKEASYKIASADIKIQELFGGIELFLKMLLASQPLPSISTLNSPQAEEAVHEACNILNLSPAEMQNIVNSTSTSNHIEMNWLQECYELIHLEEFSEKLGHLLFDAVNHIIL